LAVAKRAVISYSVDGDKSSSELLFECVASEESSELEVGSKHIFVNANKLGFHRDRSPCELRVWVRRRSGLSAERAAKLGVNEEKIGELGFFPALEPGPGDLWKTQPASLETFVFVNDDLFADIANALKAGRTTDVIHIEIERKGVLAYGWEPDGSRIVWEIENINEPSYVDVTGLKIRLSLFG
jgi:hypothetical protein